MLSLPPQNPPVFRDPFGPDRPDDADDTEFYAAVQALGGVQPSQTQCEGLRGPARSLCYATVYGLSV
jgi:hypothetical protein